MKIDRAVAVYVLNDKKELLLLLHKKLGTWLPPGGHVENNELIHVAAKREVLEDTGVDIEFVSFHDFPAVLDERASVLPQPMLIQLENLGDHYHEDFVFLSTCHSSDIVNHENHEMGWFSVIEAQQLHLFENTKKHIAYIEKIMHSI